MWSSSSYEEKNVIEDYFNLNRSTVYNIQNIATPT
jgi:hypothetical protein